MTPTRIRLLVAAVCGRYHRRPPLRQHAQVELSCPTRTRARNNDYGAFEPTDIINSRNRFVVATFTREWLRVAFWGYHPFRRFGHLEGK